MQGTQAIGGALFFLVWMVMMGGMLIGYIIMLVSFWRGMKAHEAIASTLQRLADHLEYRRE